MRIITQLVLTILTASATFVVAQDEKRDASGFSVSAQGWIRQASGPWSEVSPRGLFEMEITPVSADLHSLRSDLRIASKEGGTWTLRGMRGGAYFISDAGRIAMIENIGCHAASAPSRITVLDLAGRTLFERLVHAMANPKLSMDGARLVYRSKKGVFNLDLDSFEETAYPCFDLFDAGPGNRLAGVHLGDPNRVIFYEGSLRTGSIVFPGKLRKIEFAQDGTRLFMLTPTALVAHPFPSGPSPTVEPKQLFTPSAGAELRDLHVSSHGLYVGVRRIEGNQFSGALVSLDPKDGKSQIVYGPVKKMQPEPCTQAPQNQYSSEIPWPFQPNAQHPVGCTHGQYLTYDGWPSYLHPGIDLLGPPGEAVYAVRKGVVKALHTTGGDLFWRIAIGDQDTTETCKGYLYVHFVESSIAVNLGDPVVEGQYLGDMVGWAHYDYTHLHLARIQDTGAQWTGQWLCTENCHLDLENQDETEAPVFENALGDDLFAFCTNQTSNYLDPQSLLGEVDIIVRMSDKIESNKPCTVQEIRYTIYPVGAPQSPVVENKLAVRFDMELDVYQGGPGAPLLMELLFKKDGVCDTHCNLVSQEFYHIITNSDGNQIYEQSDLLEAWDTTLVPDGEYVVEVTARDVAGNETTQSMTVTTDNVP